MPEPVKNEDLDLEELEPTPEIKEGEEDKTDYKALAIKNHGIAQRNKTKLDKLKAKIAIDAKVEKKVGEITEKKPGELDRLDRAVLRTEKITDPKEIDLVSSIMKETGKDLESVLASRYFQAELKEMRELAATADAQPDKNKRSGTSTRNDVDYWLAKDELPPASEVELRRKVVNAKIAKQKQTNTFSDNPIS